MGFFDFVGDVVGGAVDIAAALWVEQLISLEA